jgi:prepilin-type N-terminal cleavage/methylation domain-containing protein
VPQPRRHRGAWRDERGFTLIEVLVTIILMGIVFAIATSTWFGVVESRRVDSATNQIVSELRRAHTSATTRLTDWRVEMDAESRDYRIGPDGGTLSSRSLEEGTKLTGDVSAVVFKANGEAEITSTGTEPISVAAADDAPCHTIEINTVTSRIEVSRNAC